MKVVKNINGSCTADCYFHLKGCNNLANNKIIPMCTSYKRDDKTSVLSKEIKKDEIMGERTIKVNLETAKKWYKGDDKGLITLAKQAFTVEELENDDLPKTWEEFCARNLIKENEFHISSDSDIFHRCTDLIREIDDNKNVLPSKKSAEGRLALMQLEQLRDCYRQGWKPNWSIDTYDKFVIYCYNNKLSRATNSLYSRFLSFQSEEICDKFLKNFRDLIEQAKEYI